jgi:hypothetical protein
VPIEKLEQVVKAAEDIFEKENAMLDALRAGESMQAVDRRFNYEQMLRAPASDGEKA